MPVQRALQELLDALRGALHGIFCPTNDVDVLGRRAREAHGLPTP